MLRGAYFLLISLLLIACSEPEGLIPREEAQKVIEQQVKYTSSRRNTLEFAGMSHISSENHGTEISPEIYARYRVTIKTLTDFARFSDKIEVPRAIRNKINVISRTVEKGDEFETDIVLKAVPNVGRWSIRIAEYDASGLGEPIERFVEDEVDFIYEDDPKLQAKLASY